MKNGDSQLMANKKLKKNKKISYLTAVTFDTQYENAKNKTHTSFMHKRVLAQLKQRLNANLHTHSWLFKSNQLKGPTI